MRIDQIIVGVAAGDAITEAALLWRGALARLGPSEIFAMYPHEPIPTVRPLCELPASTAGDVTIYHASIGEPELHTLVLHRPGTLVLAYHNITPARFFDDIDPRFAQLLRGGRWELRQLTKRAAGAVADSTFNARELEDLGMTNIAVAPPPLHLGRLSQVDSDPETEAELAVLPDSLALVVGQILPHKRPDLAVAAHHLLNVNHNADVHLAIVGPHRNERYSSALRRHVRSINLPTVRIPGEVTDAQLATYFRRADVLLVPSEHEGFCVPIVEAFSFGVPVVARDFGAIAETCGGAALVLPRDASAPELCEAVHRVLTDPRTREELIARGSRRAQELSADRTLTASLGALGKVLRGAGPSRD
jgi:glycosyltransferase involved in cell wall biosynthesis